MQKTLELDEVFRKGLPGNQIGEGATPWRLKETRKVVGIGKPICPSRSRSQANS